MNKIKGNRLAVLSLYVLLSSARLHASSVHKDPQVEIDRLTYIGGIDVLRYELWPERIMQPSYPSPAAEREIPPNNNVCLTCSIDIWAADYYGVPVSTPESGTSVLLGSSLVAAGILFRRRAKSVK